MSLRATETLTDYTTRGQTRVGTSDTSTSEPPINPGTIGGNPHDSDVLDMRMLAVLAVARYHGIDLDRRDLQMEPGERVPSPAALVEWLRSARPGFQSQSDILEPVDAVDARYRAACADRILLFTDGSAGLLVGSDHARDIVWVQGSPVDSGDDAVAVDRLRLSQLWNGETILVRRCSQRSGCRPAVLA